MPDFSFIIPTYNAGFYIERCLKSIRSQKYQQDKIEILIADGGSADNTLEAAKNHNCFIVSNPKRLAEYGVQLGMLNARGDLVVVFAADNELVGDNWLQKVAYIFDSIPDIAAVWGRLASGENDSSLNKYFELIQSDPLNWFLNRNLDTYRKMAQYHKEGCFIFRVTPDRPLVWGANGIVYRRKKIKTIWAQEGYLGDNDAFQCMIEHGDSKVVYFDAPFVYHHHVANIGDWIKKWKRNFIQHLADKYRTRNMNWVFTNGFKMKLMAWVLYSLIPLFPLLHSLYLFFKNKNKYWLYHPVVNSMQFYTYVTMTVFTKKGRDLVKGVIIGAHKAARRSV